jgi:Ca-activated chloride channel family protein
LVFLILPAGAMVWYLLALTSRKRHAVRFSDLELLDSVAPDRPGWRRHLSAVAAVLSLLALAVAFARPVTAVAVPRERATLVLAIDVSLSMEADDVEPTRIDAAKEAALAFLDLAPEELRIGVVAFAGVALPAVAPTTDRGAAARAIQALTLAEGTAIGEAIATSLEVVAGEGEGVPAGVVVLSDGETTVGRPDLEAAAAAADLGVAVSTVSFGTEDGFIVLDGETVPVPANNGALQQVAENTGGTFSEAVSAEELERILATVGSDLGTETEQREIWEWFLAGGLVTLTLAVATSLLWFQRIP